MANSSIIKVTPQTLRTTASAFQNQGKKVSNLTTQMMSLVTNLSSSWQGDASTAYVKKFKGLEDDIQKLMKKINEYVSDLNDIANVYEQSEKKSAQEAVSLSDNVIS